MWQRFGGWEGEPKGRRWIVLLHCNNIVFFITVVREKRAIYRRKPEPSWSCCVIVWSNRPTGITPRSREYHHHHLLHPLQSALVGVLVDGRAADCCSSWSVITRVQLIQPWRWWWWRLLLPRKSVSPRITTTATTTTCSYCC